MILFFSWFRSFSGKGCFSSITWFLVLSVDTKGAIHPDLPVPVTDEIENINKHENSSEHFSQQFLYLCWVPDSEYLPDTEYKRHKT
jgi:hypothetical protein